jgi:hypothetical protein
VASAAEIVAGMDDPPLASASENRASDSERVASAYDDVGDENNA